MKQSKPYIVGITGSIASGKSTCSKILKNKFGLPVVDADQIAYQVCRRGGKGLEKIKESFGEAYLTAEGDYNRTLMAQRVEEDQEALDKLNEILHPLIREERERLFEENSEEPIIIYDCPLLFESGEDSVVDEVITIVCDKKLALDRLQRRNGFDTTRALKRLSLQMSPEEKAERSDVLIFNDRNLNELEIVLGDYLKDLRERLDTENSNVIDSYEEIRK